MALVVVGRAPRWPTKGESFLSKTLCFRAWTSGSFRSTPHKPILNLGWRLSIPSTVPRSRALTICAGTDPYSRTPWIGCAMPPFWLSAWIVHAVRVVGVWFLSGEWRLVYID